MPAVLKIILIDIDTLRPDHLGCYGYHRNTSPNLDRICRNGIQFTNCFTPDTPCLPSRSALHSGRFGFQNGAVNHGGEWADRYREGCTRGFRTSPPYRNFAEVLRYNGYFNTSISSFAGRHSSWWFLAGFHEVYDCGAHGYEKASDVTDKALEFIETNKHRENWFFHYNIWDPHTPYRTPQDFGRPFADTPLPSWMTQEIIDSHLKEYGTYCASNMAAENLSPFVSKESSSPQIRSLEDYRKWIDGYDTGIRFADFHVGKLLAKLDELGQYDDAAIIVTSDHGENMGELNVYSDHQTADLITHRVPMIVKWPEKKHVSFNALHYNFDVFATVLDMLGMEVPGKWDAVSFKGDLEKEADKGREHLVLTHAPWSCQRSVIFKDYILMKTYHDGLKEHLKETMLFNRRKDPHELVNLAEAMPDEVQQGQRLMDAWVAEQLANSDHKVDPLQMVIKEGGPFHTRGVLNGKIKEYEELGMPEIAQKMRDRYL